ncbi:beta-lactamase domain-containing protein [Mycolicibacterium canariasense]|uniref:Beta-lactamase domain-containing protein n=1 Tax=Mycolicibacterium canariasense TaxID=228230 RepID=A0A117ICC8_MYCCR|nr:N-acyl homoserine lactonase family protein [Mycolicibacterium canariasense]MCV7207405.1 N-acyl homoserine lactonase family protein [Mycolicibacterium canariasense]ORV19437.1 hydrolase [Mycolicibacterium canariasense]GAS99334.1 beta-lactamase domain-containing protein [Mycolicibacterium canariasense]
MSSENYRVTIVKYGERSTRKSDVYLNHHIYGEDDAPIGMDYFFWVLQNADRTIVVDTGFSRRGGEVRKRTFGIDPARAYAALGVDPEAAPDVVVTHAHYDHIGNLGLFPRSRLVIAQREYDFWTGPLGQRRQFHYSIEDEEIATLVAAAQDGRLHTFERSLELAPGVTLVELGGHTPGLSVVFVSTEEGTVLLASDAVHYYEELDADMPFAFVADLPAMYAGFDTITDMVSSGRVTHLVSGHDPGTLSRFTPVTEGELAGIAATIGSLA